MVENLAEMQNNLYQLASDVTLKSSKIFSKFCCKVFPIRRRQSLY